MGQVPGAWCSESSKMPGNTVDWAVTGPVQSRTRSRGGPAAEKNPEADRLLTDCPRELAETLRETRQWDALRCRPWLSASAFRGLQRSLQRCQLQKLIEQYSEAESPDDCTYTLAPVIPWCDLDADHVVSAGQIFKAEDASHSKLWQLRRLGLTVLRQGRVGVVLLAGGVNLRLGGTDAPVGCSKHLLRLLSGKSILQLCCERIRRIAALCRGSDDNRDMRSPTSRVSIPVFVMTSKFTRRAVIEHFESHRYFGLLPRDVFFFDQPVSPVLDDCGRLLPQSLGGEFAYAPGGSGGMLKALVNSSILEQMRDRGVECLHVVGTENVLARVCDPVFIGFCRELDVDCACKITERTDVNEDIDLFCVRQSPVSTQYADIEEAACGLSSSEAPPEVLEERIGCTLTYGGLIDSSFFTISYIEEVIGRPVRAHRLPRVIPYLDFHTSPLHAQEPLSGDIVEPFDSELKSTPLAAAVALGSWPVETPSPDFACQRALLAAAAEVRSICRTGPGDEQEAWRCAVHLDTNGPAAIVRVRTATRGPLEVHDSICSPSTGLFTLGDMRNIDEMQDEVPQNPLRCSLVVPSKANAIILEISLLDYFAYTDRAVAFQVRREREFAPVCEGTGPHSPEAARRALQILHCSWAVNAGAMPKDFETGHDVEVSPLVSYEGEGLQNKFADMQVPFHLASLDETIAVANTASDPSNVEPDVADGLDTRLFYMQEYPQRQLMSQSHAPQFRTNSRPEEAPQKRTFSAPAPGGKGLSGAPQNSMDSGLLPVPLLWRDVQHAIPSPAVLPAPLSSAARALQDQLSWRVSPS